MKHRVLWQVLVFIAVVELGMLAAALASRSAALLVVAIVVILMSAVAAGFYAAAIMNAREMGAKRKRDEDVYALIDRLVDDLSEAERAYLRQRLDDVAAAHETGAVTTLEALLDQVEAAKSRR